MPNFEQLGRPISLAITTPAVTVTDIIDWDFDPATEIQETFGGNKRYARVTIGNGKERLTIKTSDMAAFMLLTQGMEVGTVVMTVEGPTSATAAGGNTVTMQHASILTCTISNGRVYESLKLKTAADGKPGEYSIVIGPALKEADGAAPTVTWAFAGGGGGGE